MTRHRVAGIARQPHERQRRSAVIAATMKKAIVEVGERQRPPWMIVDSFEDAAGDRDAERDADLLRTPP